VDVPVPRFDKNMEEFYSICDQIELHLVSVPPPPPPPKKHSFVGGKKFFLFFFS